MYDVNFEEFESDDLVRTVADCFIPTGYANGGYASPVIDLLKRRLRFGIALYEASSDQLQDDSYCNR